MKAWIQITSGRGPEECCWVVSQLMDAFAEDAAGSSLTVELLDAVSADRSKTYRSVLLVVEGDELKAFFSKWEGTVQWIGYSAYRPNHKRKNWFVGVNVFFPSEENKHIYRKDIRYEVMRASGPGGQHVNKTESAVRAIHVPSGKAAVAREERSQLLNRKLATARLIKMIQDETDEKSRALQDEVWYQHNCLERGNPIRVYRGKRFDLVRCSSMTKTSALK